MGPRTLRFSTNWLVNGAVTLISQARALRTLIAEKTEPARLTRVTEYSSSALSLTLLPISMTSWHRIRN